MTLNHHSLFLLPLTIIRSGGVTFLSVYIILMIIMGAPLLLVEMFLGQFSSLPSLQILHNLCPLMTGVGVAQYITVIIKTVLNISFLVWTSRALYDVFSVHDVDLGMESVRDLVRLEQETPTSEKLFSLEMTELIILIIIIVILLIFSVGGVRIIEKLFQFSVLASSLLLATLLIRCCLTDDGAESVRSLLTSADWSDLTRPQIWCEAAGHVVLSLSTGLGVVSTLSRDNRPGHNIVRDSALVSLGHLVTVSLATVLVSSVEGMSGVVTAVNTGITQYLITVAQAMSTLPHAWMWLGLFIILVIIITLSNTLAFIHVIVSILPKLKCFISTPITMSLLFFLSLVLVNESGPFIFHLVTTHLVSWTLLLYSLISVTLFTWCHGLHCLDSDLTSLTSVLLPHIVTSHLYTSLYTVTPVLLTSALVSQLRKTFINTMILLL